VRRIHDLKRIDNPVNVCRPFAFISRTDDVKNLVAAVEAVQIVRAGLSGFILQTLQASQRNLLE